jgi:hypothetical protein
MTPTLHAITGPAVSEAPPSAVRLRLNLAPSGQAFLDGGWWPRSLDPQAELPELIAELDSRLGVITRVMINLDAWDSAPRRIAAGGRRIHVGRFRIMDAHMIGLTNTEGKRFTLLVVPPAATTAAAGTALTMATEAGKSTRPAAILAASEIAA